MRIYLVLLLFFLGAQTFAEDSPKNVGLCIVATGKYIRFVKPLIDSAEKHFLKGHHVKYFVFTDRDVPESAKIVKIFHKQIGWPFDALKRFDIYSENSANFQDLDYIYSIDADMLFEAEVGNEIFGKIVGTLHPGLIGKRGTFETDRISTAFVEKKKRRSCPYFAGAFFGGSKNEFLKLVNKVRAQIHKDLDRNYIAIWHDESHLNRYFVDNPPTVVLSPSYCYPESQQIPYERKLIALDKPDVTELRTK